MPILELSKFSEEYIIHCSKLLHTFIGHNEEDMQEALLYIYENNITDLSTTEQVLAIIKAIPKFRFERNISLDSRISDHDERTLLEVIPGKPLISLPDECNIEQIIEDLNTQKRKRTYWYPKTTDIVCKYCGSNHVIRFGCYNYKRTSQFHGASFVQRYWCKSCSRKQNPENLYKRQYPQSIIKYVINLKAENNSEARIAKLTNDSLHLYIAPSTVHRWLTKLSNEVP